MSVFFDTPDLVAEALRIPLNSAAKCALNSLTAFSSWLFDRSLLTYSNERIAAERWEQSSLSYAEQAWLAGKVALIEWPKKLIFITLFQCALNRLPDNNALSSIYDVSPIETILIKPLLEELALRLLLQNGLFYLQSWIRRGKPVDWRTSDYTRVVLTEAALAAPHLYNDYLSSRLAFSQSLAIVLGSGASSILYETTENLAPPLIAHMVKNAATIGLLLLLNR